MQETIDRISGARRSETRGVNVRSCAASSPASNFSRRLSMSFDAVRRL